MKKLHLMLIVSMSPDYENISDHGATLFVPKCCKPAGDSDQEQIWFMLLKWWAREVESSTTDLFIAESLKLE